MMTSGSLLPIMCLISSRADLTLKSQFHVESSCLTSRGSLFVVILLRLCDPDELGCSALFSSALSSLIATSSPCHHCCLFLSSCVGPVFTSLLPLIVLVFWSILVVTVAIVLWVRLAVGLCSCAPDADDPPQVPEMCGDEFCSLSSAIFF